MTDKPYGFGSFMVARPAISTAIHFIMQKNAYEIIELDF